VVPAPNRACGVCRTCQRSFPYYLCRNPENYGNSLSCAEPPHLFGGWAEFLYLRPRTPVFRVPPGLPSEVAVLTEIFAVTHSLERIAAIRRPGGFLPGDTVAVVGVGSLGMAHLVKVALMGAGRPRWSPTRSASLMPRSPSRPRWMPAPPRRSSSRTRSARPKRARTRRCGGMPSVR
jgi:threonine dehydrogenase-like Zn-dependent dehydrogenase